MSPGRITELEDRAPVVTVAVEQSRRVPSAELSRR